MKQSKLKKETIVEALIPMEEYVKDGIYFSRTKELIQIRHIHKENGKIDLYNISEQVHYFGIPLERPKLVKRVR